MILEIRATVAMEKKKLKKSPAVYLNRLINDLLMVYTKTAVAKMIAYKDRRSMEDPTGWEKAIHFDRPSTCGGTKAEIARQELQSAGLLGGGEELSVGEEVIVIGEVGQEEGNKISSEKQFPSSQQLTTTAVSLPDIKPHSPTARRSKSAGGKDKPVEIKQPSQNEILMECFSILAAHMTKFILKKERNPFNLCKVSR